MTTRTKLAMAGSALVALALVVWWTVPTKPLDPRPEEAPSNEAPSPLQAAAATGAPAARTAAGGEREALAAAAAPATGSLRVRVVYDDDRAAAADVVVQVRRARSHDAWFDHARATTDADGTARFTDLEPGQFIVQAVQRGDGGYDSAVVEPGREAAAELVLKPGMNARGVVVDGHGRPVEGADVLVADWGATETAVLARTGGDGRFALRALTTHCHIGARKAGFAPSRLRQFTASKGAEVEFTIVLDAEGAALDGTVFDPQGEPLAGAVVRLGSDEQNSAPLPDGGTGMAPRPVRVRTGNDGRFAFDAVAPGPVPLAVRARGLGPWQQLVDVQLGRSNSVVVRLEPGVTLAGTVRDASGAAVANAEIRVGEWRDVGYARAAAAADGTYRIDSLAAGELRVVVVDRQHGKAERTLRAAAGEHLRWDPVLQAGLQWRGRVLDAAGEPVARAMVEARVDWSASRAAAGRQWFAHENTDAEGRFTLRDCLAGVPLQVSVRRKSVFPEVVLDGQVPAAEELVVRLPPEARVRIRGRVVDPDGRPVENVKVTPAMRGGSGSPAETTAAGTGAFDLGPYPPGEYTLRLHADGHPAVHLPWRTLGPDEVWEVGTVQLQAGGSVVAALVPQDASPLPKEVHVALFDAEGARAGSMTVVEGSGRAGPLAPGRYVLQVSGAGLACAQHAFDVRASVETRIDVPVRRGIACELQFTLAPGATARIVTILVEDDGGHPVLRTTRPPGDGKVQLTCSLSRGSYRVVASSEDGARGEARLQVADAAVRETIELAR